MLLFYNVDKRYNEKPMRSWTIWGFDASKQVVAQSIQHFFNLFFAIKLGKSLSLECEWYMIQIISDCSFGVLLQYFYLTSMTYILKDNEEYRLDSGDYFNEDGKISCSKYLYQMFLWILVVLLVNLINLG